MARQTSAVEINNFARGLITEAGPLTFPANASVSEANLVVKRDGSRKRRLGMDLEEGFASIPAGISLSQGADLAISTYIWSDVAGNPNYQLLVVQTGDILRFFNVNRQPISEHLIHEHTIQGANRSTYASFANVDGLLIVATGSRDISVFEWENGGISHSTGHIKIRDLFGVEDIDPDTGEDLRSGSGLSRRPQTATDEHIYNLRNQTWAPPRRPHDDEQKRDPIILFQDAVRASAGIQLPSDFFQGDFPSNSDNANSSITPNTQNSTDRVGDRFHALAAYNNEPTNSPAPKGFFIIDALERSKSRQEEFRKFVDRYNGPLPPFQVEIGIDTLKEDLTLDGASVVGAYSGRVCYAGFNGRRIGGDKHSPVLSSYVLISKLVEDATDVFKCHQIGDPTSIDEPDLVDTDGLFVRVDGAKNIKKLVEYNRWLLIFAENGVWALGGGQDSNFSATNYTIQKVTNAGVTGADTIVDLEDSIIYWAHDGIYTVSVNENNNLVTNNITEETIQTYFNAIDPKDRVFAQGVYEMNERRVRWVYGNRPGEDSQAKELVIDLTLGSFNPMEVNTIENNVPKIAAPFPTPVIPDSQIFDQVVVEGQDVVIGQQSVVIENIGTTSSDRRTMYVALFDGEFKQGVLAGGKQVLVEGEKVVLGSFGPDQLGYSFSEYRDKRFYDWRSVDGVGVDSPGHAITGYMPGEDYQRRKQATYLTLHLIRTENGFEYERSDVTVDDTLVTADGSSVFVRQGGDIIPMNQSSCLTQARWDWSNSPVSYKWGREFQGYRYRRAYFPETEEDEYDIGQETIVTKNKIRGHGKVLSLMFKTEPGKDLQLQGWSMLMNSSSNV